MGAVTETTPWTQGVTASIDPGAQQLLSTGIGWQLYTAALGALDKYWVLQPHGTESASELRNRIAMVFVQRIAANWTGPASIAAVNATPTFDAIVADVSLTTRRKTPQELSADNTKRMVFWGLGILAVVAIGLLLFKKKAPAAAPSADEINATIL